MMMGMMVMVVVVVVVETKQEGENVKAHTKVRSPYGLNIKDGEENK